MAQFSSLEQAKTMQADMSAMRSEQQLLQANVLIGQTVELQVDQSTTTTGVVSGVRVVDGTPSSSWTARTTNWRRSAPSPRPYSRSDSRPAYEFLLFQCFRKLPG